MTCQKPLSSLDQSQQCQLRVIPSLGFLKIFHPPQCFSFPLSLLSLGDIRGMCLICFRIFRKHIYFSHSLEVSCFPPNSLPHAKLGDALFIHLCVYSLRNHVPASLCADTKASKTWSPAPRISQSSWRETSYKTWKGQSLICLRYNDSAKANRRLREGF